MSENPSAGALKYRGNTQFKAGNFSGACELYAQAEKTDPKDAVYPSNLSAALYETGDYAQCISAVVRSWKLLEGQRDSKHDLIVRLSGRLAKSLALLAMSRPSACLVVDPHMADIKELKEYSLTAPASASPAMDGLRRAWQEWEILESNLDTYKDKSEACLGALSRLPLFMKPMDDAKEYYTIGHDPLIDLTVGWGSGNADDPLKFDRLSVDKLSHLSFLFGGVGDGRHALATIAGLFQSYKTLSKKRKSLFNTHLTLLDIHPTAITRDLCMLMLLHQLTTATDAVERAEIKATLMYSFCAAVMPGYCFERLMSVVQDLLERLTKSPPALPEWLHVETKTVPEVLRALKYWTRAVKSTRKMLANHTYRNPRAQWSANAQMLGNTGATGAFQRQLTDRFMDQRSKIEQTLRGLSDAQLLQLSWMPPGISVRAAREFLEENMERLVDMMQQMATTGKVPTNEQEWYALTKVFFPPAELRVRHPGFVQAWGTLAKGGDVDRATLRKINVHIESDWKTNITLYDSNFDNPKYHPGGDGYKTVSGDVFEQIHFVDDFNRRNQAGSKDSISGDANTLAWDVFSTFFEEIAAALRGLSGHIAVELIAGGLSEELAKMRFKGDVTRPDKFPRKYTRMWLSNVPDYTHGPMNMAVYVVPNLQDDDQAGASCNCLLNTGSWTNDDHYCFTYTHLLAKDIPRYLGCKIIRAQAVMDVLVLGPLTLPRPQTELASRDELTSWLSRILFNTLIPGRTRMPPENVRLPNNLVAFFGLLMHLHRVGFPAHWLSDFLARILSGSMVSDIAPYTDLWPIPLANLGQRVPSRRVRTDPWLVEFETIIATAYHAIPFPVASALPAGFSCESGDIGVWEIKVAATVPFSASAWSPFMGYANPYEPVTRLLFYKPSADAPATLIGNMRAVFEGSASPAPGSFFVLTAQELVQYETRIRFKLSKGRVERMKAEKWSVVAYRQDTSQQVTRPVAAAHWDLITGDASTA
ncbi:hypothetical protein C2E23DRAFT_785783 [Lenzites betulinus]|nr:hypothetical protein C2E23DRAFT_785783 [Lenzites betulinus]